LFLTALVRAARRGFILCELRKNEVKQLKGLDRAQNRTPPETGGRDCVFT
jgi:hypothetical protein